MKERPILFSAPMVRALLAGTKTQTRRALRPQPTQDASFCGGAYLRGRNPVRDTAVESPLVADHCPYGVPGDRLWVRETLRPWTKDPERMAYAADDALVIGDGYCYPTRCGDRVLKFVPSIHLHRCWARLTLYVSGVRVERLQEISDADAVAEGVTTWRDSWDTKTAATMFLRGTSARIATKDGSTAQRLYFLLWESINGAGSWAMNPWVWVVRFRELP